MEKLIYIAAVAVMVCLSLAGCRKTGSGSSLTSVTLNEVTHPILYAPQYAAIELGYFKDEGIDLTLINGAGTDKVMTVLVSGNVDIGFMDSEASIYAYMNGAEDYAANFVQLAQWASSFLVGRQPEENFQWSNLAGKKIPGGRAGDMPQMVFEYILKKNGLDPKTDLTIDQSINFGLVATAFTGGDTDYTVEFKPFATGFEMEGSGYVMVSLGEEPGYVPCTAYCAKKSYMEENLELIQKFTSAIQKGMDYVNSHGVEEIVKAI